MKHLGFALLSAFAAACSTPTPPAASTSVGTPPMKPDDKPEASAREYDAPPPAPVEKSTFVDATPAPKAEGASACEAASLTQAATSVLAKVDGKEIKVADLGEDFDGAMKKALSTYCNEVHRLHSLALDNAIEDAVLSKAAEAAGKDKNAFVMERVSATIKPPGDEELQAYYDKFKREGAPPFADVRDQVERAVMEERSKEAYASLVADLRGKASVERQLPDLRPPALDIDVPEHSGSFGPTKAAVEIVEFSDFECPYCARAATAVSQVKKRYGDRVRFAFRHFPLSFHANARPAAEYAHCANEQGKFWAMHDEIFANQSGLSADSLRSAAQSAGLDIGELEQCLASDRPDKAIDEDMAKAQEVGVEGTPTFYINGRPYQGGIDADALAQAIEAELG